MNFATQLARNSGRATPSLRCTPIAHHNKEENPAEIHLSQKRSCSDNRSQLCSPDHHDYDKTASTKGSAARAQTIRQGIVNDPTPGNDKPATKAGTPNNASPSDNSLVGLIGRLVPSPVLSYTRTDPNGNTMVVNVTQPGHPLFPGYVIRETVRDANGNITVHNYGEGTGWLQGPNSPFANTINNVWPQQTQDTIDSTPQ